LHGPSSWGRQGTEAGRQAGRHAAKSSNRSRLEFDKTRGLEKWSPEPCCTNGSFTILKVYVVLTKIILIEQILRTSFLGRDSWLRGNYDNIE